MSTELKNKTIKIAGAGLSGVTAAIVLARAGKNVEIFEQNDCIGRRFQGDFQGIENWIEKMDALDFLKQIGIEINFDYKAYEQIHFWGPDGIDISLKPSRFPFYLVKRGIDKGSLDYGLEQQLKKYKNIKVYYNHKIENFSDIAIISTGPRFDDKNVDGFVAGYSFNTDLSDRAIMIFDDELAINGYSYFHVHDGYGIIATCIFKNFEKLIDYRTKTLNTCKRRLSFDMKNIKTFTGTGNMFIGDKKFKNKIYTGEAAGLQDFLWGFGMRFAFTSGQLAAKSILENKNYYSLINKNIFPTIKASIANRFIFSLLGKNTSKLMLNKLKENENPLKILSRFYNPNIINKLIYPLAKLFYIKHLSDPRLKTKWK